MTRRKAFAVILLLALVSGIGVLYIYPMFNPVHVDAAKVDKGNLYVTVKAAGQVVPKELVTVPAAGSVRVVAVQVSLGQDVKKGDALMDVEVVAAGSVPSPSASPAAAAPPSSQTPAPTATPAPPSPSPAPSQPATSPTVSTSPPAPTATPSPQQSQPSPSPGHPTVPPDRTPTQAPSSPSPSFAPAAVSTQAPPSPSPAPSATPVPPSPSPAPAQPAASPTATPPPATPSPAPSGGTYTVQPGDTLSEIAQRNGTTVDELARSNGISNPNLIYPGQQLNIPQGKPGQGGSFDVPSAIVNRIVTTIYSPIDGQVTQLESRADQLVADKAPLVVLADTSALFLEVPVDKEDLANLSQDRPAQTVLDALSKETIKGKVAEIGSSLTTTASGTSGYPVRISLDNPPKGIRLGMTGQTEVIGKQLSGVIYVPKRAVEDSQDGTYVFVVEGDQAQKTIVTVGQLAGDYYVITSGVVPDQVVVVSKLDEIDDGHRVTVDRILGPK